MEASPLLLVFTLITAVLLCLSQLLLRFLAIILTAAASNYWVLIPAFLVMAVFLFFRWYYLKTSREIKRLEAIGRFQVSGLRKVVWHDRLFTCGKLVLDGFSQSSPSLLPSLLPPARSPLYSHISTTLQGLPTIRTFGKQSVALDHFHKYQNEHTQVSMQLILMLL